VELDDPMAHVEAAHADVAITVLPRKTLPAKGVELVHLLDDPYRAVLPKTHPLARKRVLDLTEFAEEPWVGVDGLPGICREILLGACASAGFAPNVVV